jgi:hypothetical protein
VPAVADRVAQTVAARRLEEKGLYEVNREVVAAQ